MTNEQHKWQEGLIKLIYRNIIVIIHSNGRQYLSICHHVQLWKRCNRVLMKRHINLSTAYPVYVQDPKIAMTMPAGVIKPNGIWPYIQSWASYQIRKIAGCACAGNAGNVSPRRRFQRKPLVGDPGMHHGTCVTHVPWCMSGSLTCGDGENVPGIPGACAPATLRIWQEAHDALTHLPWTKWPPFGQTTFSNAFSWMKMIEFRFKFHWNLLPGVQFLISQ